MAKKKSGARKTSRSAPPPGAAGDAVGYTVLARRYRSRDFDEIIGQEPIARTLRNAIASGRTAHAYLFTGTRGVGKTSMARIFAKTINVNDSLGQAEEIAAAILRGEDLDVIEIDGASNRGVQEARDLIAGAGLSPTRCPYKIYIIDEVHMLTRDAFNALLKTMEEPPSHVKFVLCTTEPHKVPATIQSRCQRFDFRSLSSQEISQQLRTILAAEKVQADDEVISAIARLGNGSMRDALSLLDRVLAGGDRSLTSDLVDEMLGLPSQGLILEMVDAFIASDPRRALEAADELLARGTSVEQVLSNLAEHLRDVLILSTCGEESPLVDRSAEVRQAAARQAKAFDGPGLVHMIARCDAVARSARSSVAGRALLDATLVQLSLSERFADVESLLHGAEERGLGAEAKKKDQAPVSSAVPRAPAPREDDREGAGGGTVLAEPKPAASEPHGESGATIWSQVLAAATTQSQQATMSHLQFESFDGTTLRVSIRKDSAEVARWIASQLDAITQMVQQAIGRRVQVSLMTPVDDARAPGRAPAASMEAVRQAPLVERARTLLDARIVNVEEINEDPGHADPTEEGQ